jgi:hypothetical protein
MISRLNRIAVIPVLVTIGILFGLLVPFFIDYIFKAGHLIGSAQIGEDYVRAICWALAIGLFLAVLPFPKEIHKVILWLWLGRCFVVLGFMLIYEDHYDLDAYHYFRDSLSSVAPSGFSLGQGTNFVTSLAWFINQYIPWTSSYHTLKIFWSLAGLTGVYYYYKTYLLFSNEHNVPLLITLGLFPSMIFWSSILGKDPLTFLGISLLAYGGLRCILKLSFRSLAFVTIGFLLILMVRFWLAGILIFSLVVASLMNTHLSRGKKVLLSLVTLGCMGFVISLGMDKWSIGSPAELVDKVNLFSKAWSRGGSGQAAPNLGSLAEIALFIPQGVFAALFRPLPGEIANIFGFLAGGENLILIVGFIFTLVPTKKKDLGDPLFYFIITFIFIWSLMYGFISYQNLGTASRFKLQVLPFMIILPFYIKFKNSKKTKDVRSMRG